MLPITATLGGRLLVADLDDGGSSRVLDVPGPVVDPRPDPSGTRVAWVRGGDLWVADLDDPASAHPLTESEGPHVTWGQAEFVAAEEMDRSRGYWWAPDGTALLVARVDDSPVARWWIADPARPEQRPNEVAYPAAGTANAIVSAWLVPLDGTRAPVIWDAELWPYLAHAAWDQHGPLVTLVQRDQRALQVLAVDPADGSTTIVWADSDDAWVERTPGTPARLADGALVVGADRDGTRKLLVAGASVTPDYLHVRSVSHAGGDEVVFTANPVTDATILDVWRWRPRGLERLTRRPGYAPTPGDPRGVHGAAVGGDIVALRRTSLDQWGATVSVYGRTGRGTELLARLANHAAVPVRRPEVNIRHVGRRRLATALLLPQDASPTTKLPVLLDPYGGPHAQRVIEAQAAYGTSQWFADQGFAVVVVDGRGTPGRGSAWERAIHGDLATAVLEDQLDALAALAAEEPRLDLSRVAIRGWSFGGYLAALAVLRHPDVVHAAVAGAPVTDWRLYDTFYTERYLGQPGADGGERDLYEASSLIADAPKLSRPLLLIHGLADDNVVSAHTLRLSAALLAAGRPHQVLPLTGVTHMASQEEVAENLLVLQLAFLRSALAIAPAG